MHTECKVVALQVVIIDQAFSHFSKKPTRYSKMSSDTVSVASATLKETTMITVDEILSSLKSFETAELFKLIKAATTEAEKKSKTPKTATKATTAKKTGSMPKGTIPPQLKKPRAWVEFTLNHALENGWEAFTVVQKKKVRGEGGQDVTLEEQIEMPASELHDGAYVFKGSVTEKTPQGRQLIHKEAMSLSKQRKDANHSTYAEFEAQYVDETSDDESVTSSTSSQKKIVVKKTAAEKEAEAEAKRAAKEAEKEAKKAEKKAEKEAEKAAEKAAKKAEKEALAEQKKETKKPVAAKAPVPAKVTEEKPVVAKKKAVKA